MVMVQSIYYMHGLVRRNQGERGKKTDKRPPRAPRNNMYMMMWTLGRFLGQVDRKGTSIIRRGLVICNIPPPLLVGTGLLEGICP